MVKEFAVVGGDLRTIKLAKILAKEGNMVYTYGLEKAEELKEIKNIIFCEKLIEAVKMVQVVIGPIPFSSDGININMPFSDGKLSIREFMHNLNAKILIAGTIAPDVYELANDEYIEIVDIMKREELAVLNTIATAEGAIEIAIANTNKILHGSNVLVLGFGRIGKVLARKLAGLSTKVTCAARKEEDLAWIKAYGHKGININQIDKNLSEFDVIINTVPQMILTAEKLGYVKQECLLIDLASNPGGIDKKVAKEKGLQLIWALALPGKVAPTTTAEFIKDTIYNILKEIGMPADDRTEIVMAIGNHDEGTGTAVSDISAALILADKSDVHRNRVRNRDIVTFDKHDKVNYAVTNTEFIMDREKRKVTLNITIDNTICPVLDYFDIFMERTKMSKYAAKYLNIWFELIINGTKLL